MKKIIEKKAEPKPKKNKIKKTKLVENKENRKKIKLLFEIFLWFFFFVIASLGIFFIFLHIDFQKLPFIGKTIEHFSKTKTRIIQEQEVLSLQTASFNIDFLLRLETEDGYYVGIYPYEVVLGIDLSKINTNSENNLSYKLPMPEIVYAEIADNDSILEIKNSIKENVSYNTIISPIKKAFEQKAIDEAIQNDYFLNTFFSRIKNAIQELETNEIVFENEDEIKTALKESMRKIKAPHLPAEFLLNNSFLRELEINENFTNEAFDFSSLYKRDDLQIAALRFGLIKNFAKLPSMSYTSFRNKNLLKKNTRLIASWHNPLDENNIKTFLFADENGYEKAISIFQDGSISYLEPSGMNIDEKNAFYAYPLAYTAISTQYKAFNPIEKKVFQDYGEFIALYDRAIQYLEEEKYTRLELEMRQIENYEHDEKEGIQLLKSLFDAAVFYRYSPSPYAGYENFNALLFLQSHLTKLEHFNTEENRKDALFELTKISRNLKDDFNLQSLKALFLKNKTKLKLKDYEIQEYENDIIESGLLVSKELFSSLDTKGRTKYLINIFTEEAKKRNESVCIEEINHSQFLFLDDSYDELFIKKTNKIFDIHERIEKMLLTKPSLIILFPQKKTFSTQYHCLIFESEKLIYFENILGFFHSHQAKQIDFEKIALSSRAFRLGSNTFENDIIASVLQTIHNAYYFDQIYHIELDKNIRSQLIDFVKIKMDRPSY